MARKAKKQMKAKPPAPADFFPTEQAKASRRKRMELKRRDKHD